MFSSLTLLAQTGINHERGLNAQSYLSGNFDNVNLYNGNLTLAIPIGQTYTVGGNLDYQLSLVYNSTAWSYISQIQLGIGEWRTQAEPNPKANAGLGWMFSMGALYPPKTGFYNTHETDYLYVAPDGSEHRFLNGGAFTRDGTYLRHSWTQNKIEFPDGTTHYFNPNTYQLSLIEDKFGNRVEIDTNNPAQWIIKDKCGSCPTYTRTHYVNFVFDGSRWRVGEFKLSAFNGTEARYALDYGTAPVHQRRDMRDNWYRNPNPLYVTLWRLKSVELPANAGSYSFGYLSPDIADVNPGRITQATLPTGGHYRWEWQTYQRPFVRPENPASLCQPYCPEDVEPMSSSEGVWRKKIYKSKADADAGLLPIGAFEYILSAHRPRYDDLKGHAIVIVRSPAGDETVNYFNLDFTDDTPHPNGFYGLPFTPRESITAGGHTLYLSQEFYKGTKATGTKLRSVYVKYEVDDTQGWYDTGGPLNPRVAVQRTIYHDDLNRFSDVFNSEWNDAGKFRRTRTGGGFESNNIRETYVDYSGLPALNQPWILNLYTQEEIKEGSSTAYTQYCFNSANGLLKNKRVLKDGGSTPTPTNRDIYTVFDYNDDGNVTGEKYYGGDSSQNAPVGDVCSTPPEAPEFEVTNTYSFGKLATSKYVGLSSGSTFFRVNNEIDQSTGLVKKSTDPSAVVTNYEYDALGRLKKEMPAEDAQTVYTYTPVAAGQGAMVEIVRKWTDSGTILTQGKIIADPFGRTVEEHESVPDNNGALAFRKTEYNAMGWTTSISEWSAGTQKTIFSQFDPFGRPGSVTKPDGKVINTDYKGESYVERRFNVGSSVDSFGNVSEETAALKEYYDRFGRLIAVEEGSGANNSQVKTEYEYDVGNRLKQVDLIHNNSGASRINWALSTYGSRAFASSSHSSGRFAPAGANNGDRRGTNWGNGGGWSDGTPGQFPDHLWIDFNGAKRIDEINVFTVQDNYSAPQEPNLNMTFEQYGITDFDVYYLNVNNEFVPLAQIRGNNKVWRQIKFSPVDTTKVLVMVLNARSGSFPENYSRITELEAIGTQVSSQDKQSRSFLYDNRGFLHTETHPEINGGITYKYNSLGKVTEKVEGNHKLLFNYDKASRIGSITDGYTNRALKSYSYYGTSAPAKSLSKLKKATRHNWVKNPYSADPNALEQEVKISEEYSYAGHGGRLSSRKTIFAEGAATQYEFTQSFNYDRLGSLTSQSYPQCENAECVQTNSGAEQRPFTATYSYEHGYLTKVGKSGAPGAYASSITYHSNKTVNAVTHSNGVVDTFTKDPDSMPRVRRIRFSKYGGLSRDLGIYQYDGAGNVIKIDTDWFIYDHANRIKEGTAGTDSVGRRYKQSYAYDPMGNMIQRTTTQNGQTLVADITVDPATNRLGGNINYDAAGNALGSARDDVYVFDPLNMTKKTPGKTYLYSPGDERVWVIDKGYNDLGSAPTPRPTIMETITLRGLNNEVLREYRVTGGNGVGNWLWAKDYIYRGNTLLAAETRFAGKFDYHVDHLGSTRLVTNSLGQQTESYWYYPYGMESQSAGGERLRFTGHERDTNHAPGQALYYMHARYYGMEQGKFFSVDPGRDFDPRQPQSWNLYAYARGNPVNRTDPTGRYTVKKGQGEAFRYTSADLNNDGGISSSEVSAWEAELWRRFMAGDKKAAEVLKEHDKGVDTTNQVLLNLTPAGRTAKGGQILSNVASTSGRVAVIGLQNKIRQYIGKEGFETFATRFNLFANLRNKLWARQTYNDPNTKLKVLNTMKEGMEAAANGTSRGGFVNELQYFRELAGTAKQLIIEGID
ncbi:MAG: RHS repeat-associated core domain-containing protein [Acidobacteriota bacterium]|nr:RHS repeat-associated core domain-containing protein [Acidobacteriota bacterium]